MIIREAEEADIPQIVCLLSKSLGDGLIKKTEEVWRYKHERNPFGRSHVLVAELEDRIVGVRAFMAWEWQLGDDKFKACRAVDTATHPDFQGKGIFKKLTLQALDDIAKEGASFVFNTPNDQSRPGYLKMGWEILGKLSIRIVPILLRLKSSKQAISNITEWNESLLEELCQNHNIQNQKNGRLFTPKSSNYLKWRYFDNPIQSYQILMKKGVFVAGYVKKHTKFREYRIAECILSDDLTKKELENILKDIKVRAKLDQCQLLTYSGKSLKKYHYFWSIGPKLTLRKVGVSMQDCIFEQNLQKWNYQLGDLELF